MALDPAASRGRGPSRRSRCTQSDPGGDVLETDDRDNTAYAYIRVTGDDIEVLERGIGRDPWDVHKQIADDIRRLLRWEE